MESDLIRIKELLTNFCHLFLHIYSSDYLINCCTIYRKLYKAPALIHKIFWMSHPQLIFLFWRASIWIGSFSPCMLSNEFIRNYTDLGSHRNSFFSPLRNKMNKEAEANVKYLHLSSAPSNVECIMYCQLIYSIKIFFIRQLSCLKLEGWWAEINILWCESLFLWGMFFIGEVCHFFSKRCVYPALLSH